MKTLARMGKEATMLEGRTLPTAYALLFRTSEQEPPAVLLPAWDGGYMF